MNGEQFILEVDAVDADGDVVPSPVGPFPSREDAFAWAQARVADGSYEARPLAHPHLQT